MALEWLGSKWKSWNSKTPGPRTMLRARTVSTINIKIEKTIGWKIRDAMGYVERKLGPYLKKIFPNFVAVHYFYIVFMGLLASVIIYPHNGIAYIDALFIGTCAVTQAGLNPIDINNLMLYQQIVIYVFCTLTTPIFIHGFLAFLRLYWFEQHFDNIRETSKLNFKMRRTATIAARTQSIERQRTVDLERANPVPDASYQKVSRNQNDNDSHSSKQSNGSYSNDSLSPQPDVQIYTNGVEHLSEPSSDDDDGRRVAPDDMNIHETTNSQPNIKFAELPKPTKHVVEPRDIMMSVSMLRNNQPSQTDEDQGPALVIDGPVEREKKHIHHHLHNLMNHQYEKSERKPSIHFDIDEQKPTKKRSKLRKRSFLFKSSTSDSDNADGDDEADDNEEGDNDYNRSSENDETHDDGNELEGAQTHSQVPASNQNQGFKFGKRSNNLDVLRNGPSLLVKSPTFDKFIRKPRNSFRRRFSYNGFPDSDVIDESPTESDTDTDEEDLAEFGLRRQNTASYLSWNPKIGRNSMFVDLSEQQKEELGGVEYRAIKLLTKILVCYYVGFHILAFIFLVPWILGTNSYQEPVLSSGVSLTWWGFFTSMSSFNDLGYTLTPDSMIQFNKSVYVLLICAFFIIIGNTGFPVLLRFIIWVMFKLSKDLSLFKESLGFLLDHPRRCFTLLFPSSPTWWLLFILVTLNVVDLVLFIILDIGAAVLDGLSVGQKILDGFYQAVSTRTAGFACVDLAQLHPAVQVSYMVMMYISVLPLAISIRRTNVYEEQSLGVYIGSKQGENEEGDATSPENSKATSFIGAHLRKQLSFDLWFVFLGLFIICIAEGSRISDPNLPSFNVFQVMFEVVSAYGTVGLSLGYPGSSASFSAQFNTVSKLVIIAMVIRGRHRGLPYSLDRAIILPSDKMDLRDKYQGLHAGHTIARDETIGSQNDPVVEFFKSAAPKVLRDHIKRPSFLSSRSGSFFGSKPGSSSQHTSRHQSFQTVDEHVNNNPRDERRDIPPLFQNSSSGIQPHVNDNNENDQQLRPIHSSVQRTESISSPTNGTSIGHSSPAEEYEMEYFSNGHHSVIRNSET